MKAVPVVLVRGPSMLRLRANTAVGQRYVCLAPGQALTSRTTGKLPVCVLHRESEEAAIITPDGVALLVVAALASLPDLQARCLSIEYVDYPGLAKGSKHTD